LWIDISSEYLYPHFWHINFDFDPNTEEDSFLGLIGSDGGADLRIAGWLTGFAAGCTNPLGILDGIIFCGCVCDDVFAKLDNAGFPCGFEVLPLKLLKRFMLSFFFGASINTHLYLYKH
jgi:hypothetical protein